MTPVKNVFDHKNISFQSDNPVLTNLNKFKIIVQLKKYFFQESYWCHLWDFDRCPQYS